MGEAVGGYPTTHSIRWIRQVVRVNNLLNDKYILKRYTIVYHNTSKGRFKMHTHYNTNIDRFKPKHSHLTLNDRYNIERWKAQGLSNRKIADLLGKAPQTIHNEIKRGEVTQQVRKGRFTKVYQAEAGHRVYLQNRSLSVKKTKLDSDTKDTIVHYLTILKYSPEMMVARNIVKVPVSTIYYWIHHGHLGLSYKDLLYPRKKKASRKKQSQYFRLKGKSIETRPDVINQRLESGHYEIDTVILTRSSKPCLLVMTDRKSRHQIIRYIPNRTAQAINEQVALLMNEFHIKSITADNGPEFFRLHEVFDYEHIYFAHPYCSHERGTNENHNRLIRRFLPKGTKETTPEEVAKIENWINNYPKKIFDYKTPFEMISAG